MNGFFFIDKPKNLTSRDICNKIQHLFHVKRVGHLGTLDPFATGLLIVAVGEATKCLSLLEEDNKEYIGELLLGNKTDSGDLTGNIIDTKPFNEVTKEKILSCFKSFMGKQKQIPPMTSAIHINGVRLYDLARQGKEIVREPRDIEIYSLDLLSFDGDRIIFKTNVSKGTYIRTLASDIAERLNTCGHLINLRRTKVGNLKIIKENNFATLSEKDLVSINDFMSNFMPIVIIDKSLKTKVKNGMPLNLNFKNDRILLVDDAKNPLAIYIKKENLFKCLRGFNLDGNN